MTNGTQNGGRPGARLSSFAVWAFAVGTSVGWGSLVVMNKNYLGQAGPLGSVIGLLIGAVAMLVIARNYSYMINAFPEAGGAYAYTREVFGHDYGFLTAWFLSLTYLSMLWANATSLPLFSNYFFGGVFRFGKMYSIFSNEVYAGELVLTAAAIILVAILSMKSKRTVSWLMTALVVLFTLGIAVCFAVSVFRPGSLSSPSFVPDGKELSQVVRIAFMSPWAFIGFESVSHGAEEYTFKRGRIRKILFAAVITTVLLYVFVTLLSVTAYPEEYSSWLEYIRDLPDLEGVKALPAFYAAERYLGSAGVGILMASLLALVVSSLVGNTFALSRLFYSLGKDKVLPKRFSELNKKGIPEKAILLIAGVSVVVPFLGRTAIEWIVDVTTLGAGIVYGLVSAAVFKLSKEQKDRHERVTGAAGIVLTVAVGLYILLPNLFSEGTMETESFFLFVVWSVIGFIYFRTILRRDKERRFGKSVIVWIALLSLVLFVSLVWMTQSNIRATSDAMNEVEEHYVEAGLPVDQSGFIADEMQAIRWTNARSMVIVIALFGVSLSVLITNYRIMSRRALKSEEELFVMRDYTNKDPLTGTKSKHAYAEFERETDEKIKGGASSPFAVAVCDVNGLKFINDTYGHKAGDACIVAAGQMICETFKHSPVFRTGGDEFVVFLQDRDYENREELRAALDRLSEEHIKTNEAVVSVGVSEFDPGSDGKLADVFERADALMYERKQKLKSMGAATR